jgi:hypothetical protein
LCGEGSSEQRDSSGTASAAALDTARAVAAGHHPALPFGDFKQSDRGRENGREGIEADTGTKSVAVALHS